MTVSAMRAILDKPQQKRTRIEHAIWLLFDQGHEAAAEAAATDLAAQTAELEEVRRVIAPKEDGDNQCLMCKTRGALKQAEKIIDEIPVINSPVYDDAISNLLDSISNTHSVFMCMCDEVIK